MLEGIPLKHKAPLRCRLHTIVFGRSMSIMFARCTLGCKRKCKKCSGCKENIQEMYREGFSAAFLTKKFNHTGRVPVAEKMEVLNGNTQRQNI
jgi:hypothetical protein